MNDLRSLPDTTLRLYLYAIGAWGVIMAIAYPFGELRWALFLCFPLTIWMAGLTAWWFVRARRRVAAGELKLEELAAGVRSVARMLAGAGLLPGIVFLAKDPFIVESWTTFAGVAALSGIGWLAANFVPKRLNVLPALVGVLVFTALVLPANATGSVSVAWFSGWFDVVLEPTGLIGEPT